MPTYIRAWPHPRDSANLSSASRRRRRRRREGRSGGRKKKEAIPTKAAQRHSFRGRLFHMLNVLCPVKRTVEIRTSEAWYWIKRLVIKDAAVSKDRGIIFVFSPPAISSRVMQETRKFERVIFKRVFLRDKRLKYLKITAYNLTYIYISDLMISDFSNGMHKRCQHSAGRSWKFPTAGAP